MIQYFDIIDRNLENEVIHFLRCNGYKPRRTEKYFINLGKKLKRKGLTLNIIIDSKFDWQNHKCDVEYKIYFERS